MGIKRTTIELHTKQRDDLLDLAADDLPNDLVERLRIAKPRLGGVIDLECDEYELDMLIGSLTFEINHHNEEAARKQARGLKAILTGYREQLKI